MASVLRLPLLLTSRCTRYLDAFIYSLIHNKRRRRNDRESRYYSSGGAASAYRGRVRDASFPEQIVGEWKLVILLFFVCYYFYYYFYHYYYLFAFSSFVSSFMFVLRIFCRSSRAQPLEVEALVNGGCILATSMALEIFG